MARGIDALNRFEYLQDPARPVERMLFDRPAGQSGV
jgi:hypothetical protein